METIDLKKIVPDKNQPRKYFAADKMHTLKESIKKHGIKQPLVVQDMGSGKYLLIDGERRFRAATELKLPKVPVVIEKPTNAIDRLIVQFNIQEQHEGWTPVEKANALIGISSEMGVSLKEAMNLLNISRDAQRRYAAFALLRDKAGFAASGVPVDFAPYINAVKNACNMLLEGEFTPQDEKKLEQRVVQLILDGDVQKRSDITRIKDAFTKNPKLIKEFLSTKITGHELYKKSKAKGAYHYRNLLNNAMWVSSHGNRFLDTKDVPIKPEHIASFKTAVKVLEKIINLAE